MIIWGRRGKSKFRGRRWECVWYKGRAGRSVAAEGGTKGEWSDPVSHEWGSGCEALGAEELNILTYNFTKSPCLLFREQAVKGKGRNSSGVGEGGGDQLGGDNNNHREVTVAVARVWQWGGEMLQMLKAEKTGFAGGLDDSVRDRSQGCGLSIWKGEAILH